MPSDDRVGTAVLELVSPRFGVPVMAIAIMISTFGCVNGLILMGARLYYAMARDGLFFSGGRQAQRRGVPAVGLILQGALVCLLVFSGTYGELLDYVIFAALLFYALTVAGLFVLRRKRPDAERPYRALGYPVVPALYVLLCAADHGRSADRQAGLHLAGVDPGADGHSGLLALETQSMNQLLARKSLETLQAEMEGENRLHRVLGPWR